MRFRLILLVLLIVPQPALAPTTLTEVAENAEVEALTAALEELRRNVMHPRCI